ncbi:hypothetical protein Acr_15g0009040 [Actinidia rufa]|uniref:Secreted protein n=1 Tax=Actinidia rufa TaxID=165716 RepID=A0A7J0FUB9_9ERIC|nr:hypothetical protein Acr_15g0009040 [Actinidia rufa]
MSPPLLYAATWTTILTITVAVASFSPEIAFVSAISPASAFSRRCRTADSVRVPIDSPAEVFCFPAHMFRRSKLDLVVPPVFRCGDRGRLGLRGPSLGLVGGG